MLSIGKLGRGQENYYLATVARGVEDYYTGSGEAPGVWLGAGAARLGLVGEVDPADLRLVLGGVNPRAGEALGGHNGRANRVPGWDLTFSAPKSASVLYALGAAGVPAQVIEAHRQAVAAGIGYLERHATQTRRSRDGVVELVRGEGVVAAAFRHRTSRAGDPQLHTHCLVANVVERVDGGWGALHSPAMYRQARTAGFVYQAVLRAELTERLGVSWGEIVNGHAEIDGIDPRLLVCFSKRRIEIEAALAARGEDSPAAAQAAALDTRHAKDYGVDPATLHERWRAEAAELDADVADLSGVLARPGPAVTVGTLEMIAEDLLGERGLTLEQATFDRKDVMRAWCAELPAGAAVDLETLEELVEGLLEDPRVLPVVDGTGNLEGREITRRPDGTVTTSVAVDRRWTTSEMLAVEQRLIDRAEQGRHTDVATVPVEVVTAVTAADTLSVEQRRMVEALCTSGNGVDVVVGRAGTGKTYALAAAARAWRTAGFHPVGVALAARAAAELEGGAGIPSTTVEQFLIDCDQSSGQVLDRHQVVVLDEAGMVDTRRLARLVAHVHAAGAKVVLVGDHHQLPAVEAGGGFAALARRLEPVELTENRRQVEAWERATLDQLRTGAGGRAGIVEVIDRYDHRGRLHIATTPADTRAAMVTDWYETRRAGASPMMLALRRRDVDDLNARARALLVADGTVSPEPLVIGGRPFAAGDRVVCLHNDRRIGVHNALFAEVEAVEDDSVVLATDGHRRVRVPLAYVAEGHLAHAYATTIHKAQGATYDRALFLGDDCLYRQAGYAALSRGRQRNDLYLVADDDRDRDVELEPHGTTDADHPAERFIRALGRDGAKHTATEQLTPRRALHLRPLTELWAERDRLAEELPSDAGTEDRDHDVDSQLHRLDRAIRARVDAAGRAAEIDRPDHITAVLGDPPVGLAARHAWRTAAGTIESYCARWGLDITTVPENPSDEQVRDLGVLVDAIDSALAASELAPVADLELG